MVAGNYITIKHEANKLTYDDVCRIARKSVQSNSVKMINIQLIQVDETTTAALARLVVLRRDLLKNGQDLRITGLCRQANDLYEITRMRKVLPRHENISIGM